MPNALTCGHATAAVLAPTDLSRFPGPAPHRPEPRGDWDAPVASARTRPGAAREGGPSVCRAFPPSQPTAWGARRAKGCCPPGGWGSSAQVAGACVDAVSGDRPQGFRWELIEGFADAEGRVLVASEASAGQQPALAGGIADVHAAALSRPCARHVSTFIMRLWLIRVRACHLPRRKVWPTTTGTRA